MNSWIPNATLPISPDLHLWIGRLRMLGPIIERYLVGRLRPPSARLLIRPCFNCPSPLWCWDSQGHMRYKICRLVLRKASTISRYYIPSTVLNGIPNRVSESCYRQMYLGTAHFSVAKSFRRARLGVRYYFQFILRKKIVKGLLIIYREHLHLVSRCWLVSTDC